MTETEDVWSFEINGRSIGDALDRAIESGAVRRRPDGRFELAEASEGAEMPQSLTPYIGHGTEKFGRPCRFLNGFLFRHVYGEAAVPFGCRACYKVKVVSRSLRQLMAVKAIAETLPHSTKSGPEGGNPDNPHPYGTYFYFHGLDQARELYGILRPRLDEDSRLGPETEMFIKRGCTNYEIKCGPSDRYSFDPTLEAVEAALEPLFVAPTSRIDKKILNGMRMLEMIHTAYRMGDETYRDFTGGRSLAPAVVRYSPEPGGAGAEDAGRAGDID